MGGQIAMTTMLAYPTCADALVLCAPAGLERFSAMEKTMFYSSSHLLDFFSSDAHSLRTTIESSFHRQHNQGESVIKELTDLMKNYKPHYYHKMIEDCIKGMLEGPVMDKLPQLTMPVLVMFGNHDALIPNKLVHHTTTERIAEDAVKKMSNATLEMIPDCGHFIQWERAADVNRNIIRFLEQL